MQFHLLKVNVTLIKSRLKAAPLLQRAISALIEQCRLSANGRLRDASEGTPWKPVVVYLVSPLLCVRVKRALPIKWRLLVMSPTLVTDVKCVCLLENAISYGTCLFSQVKVLIDKLLSNTSLKGTKEYDMEIMMQDDMFDETAPVRVFKFSVVFFRPLSADEII